MLSHRVSRAAACCVAVAALTSCTAPIAGDPRAGLAKIGHIVVIYAENRSFDNLYGLFPGASGVAEATPQQYTQVDQDSKPLPHLPPVWKGREPDPAFPRNRIDAPPINLPLTERTRDLIHKFYPQQEQIDGGKNEPLPGARADAGDLTGAFDFFQP
jgi:phospholipase C